jgi:hypothetical protein
MRARPPLKRLADMFALLEVKVSLPYNCHHMSAVTMVPGLSVHLFSSSWNISIKCIFCLWFSLIIDQFTDLPVHLFTIWHLFITGSRNFLNQCWGTNLVRRGSSNVGTDCCVTEAVTGQQEVWFGGISGSDGGEYEDDCLLGCLVVQSGRNWPRFISNGGSKHLWNVGQFLPDYMAQHFRRQSSSSQRFVFKFVNILSCYFMVPSGLFEGWGEIHVVGERKAISLVLGKTDLSQYKLRLT